MPMDPKTYAITLDKGGDETIRFVLPGGDTGLDLTQVTVEVVVHNAPALTVVARADSSDPTIGYLDFPKEYAQQLGSKAKDYAFRITWQDGKSINKYSTISAGGFAL